MKSKYFFLVVSFLFLPLLLFSSDIWQAANNGDLEQIKKFVEVGNSDVNIKNEDGWSLLHVALIPDFFEYHDFKDGYINDNMFKTIKYLIEKGANINVKFPEIVKLTTKEYYYIDVYTPLQLLVMQSDKYSDVNNDNAIKVFLENGADIKVSLIKNAKKMNILEACLKYRRNLKIIKLLSEYNDKLGKNKLVIRPEYIDDYYYIFKDDATKIKESFKRGKDISSYLDDAIYANSTNILILMQDLGLATNIINNDKDQVSNN